MAIILLLSFTVTENIGALLEAMDAASNIMYTGAVHLRKFEEHMASHKMVTSWQTDGWYTTISVANQKGVRSEWEGGRDQEGGRERENERERVTNREGEREWDGGRERMRWREGENEREGERERENDREGNRMRGTKR